MGWILTPAITLGSALFAYLVLFFISTERGSAGEVLLRERSSFWWVKYGAYFPFALLKEMFDTPVMRPKEYNWKYVNTLCEDYADKPMSLCKTFWVSFTLLLIFCPIAIIGFSIFGLLVGVLTGGWLILVGIVTVIEFILWPFKKVFFDIPKKFLDAWKEKRHKKYVETIVPASTLAFHEAYVVSKGKDSPGRGLVQPEEYFDLYYKSDRTYPGELLKVIDAVKEYQAAHQKKKKLSAKKKSELIFEIMDSMCYFLKIYWEVGYGKKGLEADVTYTTRPFLFLAQLAAFVKQGKYFSGRKPYRFQEDLIQIFDYSLRLQIRLRDQEIDSRADFFDMDEEETDEDAYETYLSKEANKLQNELEKDWLQNEYEIFFERYKEFILTFFGDKVESSGIADIERKIVAARELKRHQEMLQRQAEEKEQERQRALEKEKDARRQHYINLLNAFFSKVCPIIRVKPIKKP